MGQTNHDKSANSWQDQMPLTNPFTVSESFADHSCKQAHQHSDAVHDRYPHRKVDSARACLVFAQSIYRHGIRKLHGCRRGPWSNSEIDMLRNLVRSHDPSVQLVEVNLTGDRYTWKSALSVFPKCSSHCGYICIYARPWTLSRPYN